MYSVPMPKMVTRFEKSPPPYSPVLLADSVQSSHQPYCHKAKHLGGARQYLRRKSSSSAATVTVDSNFESERAIVRNMRQLRRSCE